MHTQKTLDGFGWAGKGATALQATLVILFVLCIVEMSSADSLKQVAKYNLLKMWGNPLQ